MPDRLRLRISGLLPVGPQVCEREWPRATQNGQRLAARLDWRPLLLTGWATAFV